MRSGGIAPPFLTSALNWGERSVSRYDRFTSETGIADTHWIGGWVDPSARLDTVEKKKIPCSCRGSNPGCRDRRYTVWAIPAFDWLCAGQKKLSSRERNFIYCHRTYAWSYTLSTGFASPAMQLTQCEAEYSLPSSAKIKNAKWFVFRKFMECFHFGKPKRDVKIITKM
jgi:hypothetical protein